MMALSQFLAYFYIALYVHIKSIWYIDEYIIGFQERY
jgi:hypothetical protein